MLTAVKVAGLIQPADLNILMMGADGQYRLVAMMLGIGGKLKVGALFAFNRQLTSPIRWPKDQR